MSEQTYGSHVGAHGCVYVSEQAITMLLQSCEQPKSDVFAYPRTVRLCASAADVTNESTRRSSSFSFFMPLSIVKETSHKKWSQKQYVPNRAAIKVFHRARHGE
ncbi:MAG TPA: hypothetical protein VF092_06170 [Longimicrobium sp.]